MSMYLSSTNSPTAYRIARPKNACLPAHTFLIAGGGLVHPMDSDNLLHLGRRPLHHVRLCSILHRRSPDFPAPNAHACKRGHGHNPVTPLSSPLLDVSSPISPPPTIGQAPYRPVRPLHDRRVSVRLNILSSREIKRKGEEK